MVCSATIGSAIAHRALAASLVIATSLFLGASGASAQTTTCGSEMGKWVCRTAPARPSAPYQGIFGSVREGEESVTRLFDEQARRREAADVAARVAQEADDRDRAIALRQKAGQLVAAGRCPDARELALNHGDFDLTVEIEKVCSPK